MVGSVLIGFVGIIGSLFFMARKKRAASSEIESNEKPGLEVKFKVGEQLPWKGISFMVKTVSHDEIVLFPTGLTWQMAKKIKASKGE